MQIKNRVSYILLIASAGALLTTAGVSAHPRNEQPMHAVMQQLDLDQQQRQDLRALLQQTKQDRQVFKEDLKSLKQQLNEVIRADQWDHQQAEAIIQQKQNIDAQLAVSRANNKHIIWNTLEADQQQQFDTLMQQQRSQKRNNKHRDPMKRFARLNLNDEQRSQIKNLMADQKNQRVDSKASLTEFHQQQSALIKSAEFDQSAWLASYQQMQQSQKELALSFAYVRHQIWNTLDAEQQAKMLKMENKRKDKKTRHRQAL